jgi:hypothetical protein
MQRDAKSWLIGMGIRKHTSAMLKLGSNNQIDRYGRENNEQCLAPRPPIGRILMVTLLRRLGECSRYSSATTLGCA